MREREREGGENRNINDSPLLPSLSGTLPHPLSLGLKSIIVALSVTLASLHPIPLSLQFCIYPSHTHTRVPHYSGSVCGLHLSSKNTAGPAAAENEGSSGKTQGQDFGEGKERREEKKNELKGNPCSYIFFIYTFLFSPSFLRLDFGIGF